MGQHQSRPASPAKQASKPKVDPAPPTNRPPTPAPTIGSTDSIEIINHPTDRPPTPNPTPNPIQDDLTKLHTEIETLRHDISTLLLKLSSQEQTMTEERAALAAALEQQRKELEQLLEATRQKQREEEETRRREEKEATRRVIEELEGQVKVLKVRLEETDERQKRTSTDLGRVSEKVEARLKQRAGVCIVM